jgi:hypothetical protein
VTGLRASESAISGALRAECSLPAGRCHGAIHWGLLVAWAVVLVILCRRRIFFMFSGGDD